MNLVNVALASFAFGTIMEAEGPRSHDFWLRNDCDKPFAITQTFASCGCTTIHANMTDSIQPGDSTKVTVSFNPRGRGGEFYETATIVCRGKSLDPNPYKVTLSIEGSVVTSEETLRNQFPYQIDDSTYISDKTRDLGVMKTGSRKTVYYSLLHLAEGENAWQNARIEHRNFEVVITDEMGKGVKRFKSHNIDFTVLIK